MTSRISAIGGPEGWEARKTSVALIDSTADTTKTERRDTSTASVELLLSKTNFEALGGWQSKTFDAADPKTVTEQCEDFTKWVLMAAERVNSTAADLQDYWTDDCRSTLASADGEQFWFVEWPKGEASLEEVWFVGGLVSRKEDTAQLTAVVGVKNVPYGP